MFPWCEPLGGEPVKRYQYGASYLYRRGSVNVHLETSAHQTGYLLWLAVELPRRP